MSNTNCNCNCPPNDYLPPCPDIPLPPPRPLPPCPPRPGCTPGCSDQTPNYGLPLWKASDVTSWLMQINGAMLRIDTIMHDLALRTGINGLPDDLVSTVSKLNQDVEVLKCSIADLSNKTASAELIVQNMNTQVAAIKTDLSSITINLTNLDTRLMTVDTKTENLDNKMTLMRSDVNMIQQSINNLQSNMLQFQNATNQELQEHEAQLIQSVSSGSRLIKLNPSNIVYNDITPVNQSDFEEIINKSELRICVNNYTNKISVIVFHLGYALTSPFNIAENPGSSKVGIKLEFNGTDIPNSLFVNNTYRITVLFSSTDDNGSLLLTFPGNISLAKFGNKLEILVEFESSIWNRNFYKNNLVTINGITGIFEAYASSTKDIPVLEEGDA